MGSFLATWLEDQPSGAASGQSHHEGLLFPMEEYEFNINEDLDPLQWSLSSPWEPSDVLSAAEMEGF